ncbi:MAG TPA: hypothetical protein VI792_10865, partial [Candidatus Eisenbacteria bacterium]
MTHDEILKDIAAKIPVRPNQARRWVWIACMVIGAVTFAYMLHAEPLRAWGAYGVNMIYFLGISLGAAVLASAIRLSNGRWGGPIMRIAESLSAYIPFGFVFVLVMLAVGIWTYLPWTRHV